MDIIKFKNPTAPEKMEQAEIINGLTSKLWIERYSEAGEFALTAPVSSGLKELLPAGSFISHLNTTEVMIVENHEINDSEGEDSILTITGRGFETFFENRIVGSNKTFPNTGISDYSIPANNTWVQAVTLLTRHISATYLLDDNNALPYVTALTDVVGSGPYVTRYFSRGTLYDKLIELLDIDDLGIKVIRPGPWSPLGASNPNLAILIHVGSDRRNEVVFSYDTGEIVSADYLWSDKKSKNAALVTGRWVETAVIPSEAGYERRWMFIDASDLDQDFESIPVGTDLDDVVAAMQQRGEEILATQRNIAITKAEVSNQGVSSLYRVDYDVGDYIAVRGDYNEETTMRVLEYVEIEDETGESGYPTLGIV